MTQCYTRRPYIFIVPNIDKFSTRLRLDWNLKIIFRTRPMQGEFYTLVHHWNWGDKEMPSYEGGLCWSKLEQSYFLLRGRRSCWLHGTHQRYHTQFCLFDIFFLPTAYVVREEVIFSVCLSVHIWGGGYPIHPADGGGGTPSQVQARGGYPIQLQVGGGGYLLSGPGGGVPTFPGLGGGVPTFPGQGGTYLLGGGVPTQDWMGG